jgi:hypothetical protein
MRLRDPFELNCGEFLLHKLGFKPLKKIEFQFFLGHICFAGSQPASAGNRQTALVERPKDAVKREAPCVRWGVFHAVCAY